MAVLVSDVWVVYMLCKLVRKLRSQFSAENLGSKFFLEKFVKWRFMCCLPASEAFIILTSFLQSCVDGCHSSATLLAHFCFLWRPFPTIMQIMIVAVPHLEHAVPPDAMLSTRPPRARTDALRSKVAIWFPVRGSLFFASMSILKWFLQKRVQNVQYVTSSVVSWSGVALCCTHLFPDVAFHSWMKLMSWIVLVIRFWGLVLPAIYICYMCTLHFREC